MKRILWKIVVITSSFLLIIFCNVGCIFESAMRPLTLEMRPALYGTVSGAGNYMVGSSVTITATPFSGYQFVEWDDYNTETIRTITIPPKGADYVAYFKKDFELCGWRQQKHSINESHGFFFMILFFVHIVG